MDVNDILLQPLAQFGFAGFSAVLLGMVIWLTRRLLEALDRNSNVIAQNTAALQTLTSTVTELMALNRAIHDKIISRPCIAREE